MGRPIKNSTQSDGALVDEQVLDLDPSKVLDQEPTSANEAVVLDTIEKEEEQTKEPMIPLSEVQRLIDEKLSTFKSELPKVQEPKVVEQNTARELQNFDLGVANYDGIPELDNWEEKDRVYVLIQGKKAASYGIRNRHKPNSPLTYVHPITRATHALRYATNQPSFFVDKQSKEAGSVTLGVIVVRGQNLFVPKSNIKLQQFLHIHPDKNIVFKELNPEEDAKKELEMSDLRFEAERLVRQLEPASQKTIAQLVCANYAEDWGSIKTKDELIKAIPKNAKWIKTLAEDDRLPLKGLAKEACIKGFIKYEDYKFIDENEKVILEVNRAENEWDAIARYFLSSKGRTTKEYLEEKVG